MTINDSGSGNPFAKKLLLVLLGATALLVVVHLVFQYLNLEVFYQQNGQIYELSNRFDLDDESSIQTWFGQALFLVIAAGAWLASRLQTAKPARRLWKIIALLGLVFSVDEVAGLHERLLQTVHVLYFQDSSPTSSANAWLVLSPVLLAGAAWLGWAMWRVLPRRTFMLFVVAGVSFVSGAVAVDLFTSAAPRETFLNQGILVAAEEAMELVGSVIALYAVAEYLERHHYLALNRALRSIKP